MTSVSPPSVFQSTLPARGATPTPGLSDVAKGHFNPRSPHGERRKSPRLTRAGRDFNPRSPHGERRAPATSGRPREPFQPTLPARGATRTATHKRRRERFQPTLPARGATHFVTFHQRKREISTHAPRTGSDGQIAALAVLTHLFQPTLPARGATCPARCPPDSGWYFNPRSPHGERRANLQGYNFNRRISTHAPRTGSDGTSHMMVFATILFQPTLPARGATS